MKELFQLLPQIHFDRLGVAKSYQSQPAPVPVQNHCRAACAKWLTSRALRPASVFHLTEGFSNLGGRQPVGEVVAEESLQVSQENQSNRLIHHSLGEQKSGVTCFL